MIQLARRHHTLLSEVSLIATRSTGRLLAEQLGLKVECVASGPEGGDLQIGARIVEGAIDALVFLRDPLTAHPHDPDIQALVKVCDIHVVPVATNRATAEIVLRHLAQRSGTPDVARHPSLWSQGHFPWDPAGTGMARIPESH
ncbi:MAG: methylglyoxal synthase [Actinomycetota bacterium]